MVEVRGNTQPILLAIQFVSIYTNSFIAWILVCSYRKLLIAKLEFRLFNVFAFC